MEIPVMAAATETLIRPRAAVRQVREAPTRPREIPIRRIISIPMRTRMRMASARSWKNL